jgi:hypothetical protein
VESPRRTRSRREPEKKARGVSGRAIPHHGEDAQEESDKGVHGEVANRSETGRMTHGIIGTVDTMLRGWNHKAVCLLTGHDLFRGYLRRFHLTETTGECICSTGTQDTAQHIIEECEDDEEGSQGGTEKTAGGHRGAFPFGVTRETKDEEVTLTSSRRRPRWERTKKTKTKTGQIR